MASTKVTFKAVNRTAVPTSTEGVFTIFHDGTVDGFTKALGEVLRAYSKDMYFISVKFGGAERIADVISMNIL